MRRRHALAAGGGGAYPQHRLYEGVLGDVTQHMVKNAEIPVLMMH